MELQRLVIAAKRNAWRPSGYYESNHQAWSKTRAMILERDKYCCQACGFSCSQYQEVHHIDGDHDNNIPDNLMTLCPLCHMTQHIGLAGVEGKARLLWLPEMDQSTIFYLVRWLELGPYSTQEILQFTKPARDFLLNFFKDRENLCQKKIGTSDPISLGNMLLGLPDEQYETDVLPRLANVRVLPNLNAFNSDIIKAWKTQLSEIIPGPDKVTSYLEAGRKK